MEDFGRSGIPVEVGKMYHLKISGRGQKGDGMGKIQGYVIFVSSPVTEGKTYNVEITKTLERQGFAEVVEEVGG